MRSEDIPCIAALESRCFSVPWTRKDLVFEYEHNEFSHMYRIMDHQQIVGYAIVWELYEQAELARIGIHPAFRKRGYARGCLMEAMHRACLRGCVSMSLEVRVSNASAMRLYETCGFHTVHTSKRHYHDGEDAYVMLAML